MTNPSSSLAPMMVILVIVSAESAEPLSRQPEMSFTFTDDITFTCDLAGFPGSASRVMALQILNVSSGKKEKVLATADTRGAHRSQYLKANHPVSTVTGGVGGYRRNTRLELSVAGIVPQNAEHASYKCHVVFFDDPADTAVSIWKSHVMLGASTTEPSGTQGFRWARSRGVDLTCSVEMEQNMSGSQDIKIVRADGNVFGRWPTEAHRDRVSEMTRHSEGNHTVLGVHLWDLFCDDEGQYLCIAETVGKPAMVSRDQYLHAGPHTGRCVRVENRTENTPTFPGLADKTYISAKSKLMMTIVLVSLSLTAGFVTVYVVLRRNGYLLKYFYRTREPAVNDELPPEAGNMTGDLLAVDLQQRKRGRETCDTETVPMADRQDLPEEESCLVEAVLNSPALQSVMTSHTVRSLTREPSESASCLELSTDVYRALNVLDDVSLCETVAYDDTENGGERGSLTEESRLSERPVVNDQLACTSDDEDFAKSIGV